MDKLWELRQLRRELMQHGHWHGNSLTRIEQLTDQLNALFNESLLEVLNLREGGLEAIRPLHWAVAFPEAFLPPDPDPSGLHADTGFHIITVEFNGVGSAV